MKKLSFYFLASVLLTSCATSYRQIGSLSLLTDRHIEHDANYQKLLVGAGSTKKELRSATALKIEDAIDNVINKVPGGKFLTNVKVYVVGDDYLAVSGDVWGQPGVKEQNNGNAGNAKVTTATSGNVNKDANNKLVTVSGTSNNSCSSTLR